MPLKLNVDWLHGRGLGTLDFSSVSFALGRSPASFWFVTLPLTDRTPSSLPNKTIGRSGRGLVSLLSARVSLSVLSAA